MRDEGRGVTRGRGRNILKYGRRRPLLRARRDRLLLLPYLRDRTRSRTPPAHLPRLLAAIRPPRVSLAAAHLLHVPQA